jgi:tetratricopeptide (TPR) repeat protein
MLEHYQVWHDWAKRTHGTDSQYYAHTCTRLAYAYVFNHRPADALAILGDARRIATRECEAKPGHKDAINHRYYALRITAEAQLMIGQEAEAKVMFAETAKASAALAAPTKPEPVLPPSEELAKREAGEAKLFDALLANPEDEATQEAWVAEFEKLAGTVEAVRGQAAAEDHWAKQLEKLEPLLAAAPEDSWWNVSVSSVLDHLGQIHERSGRAAEAEKSYRRALELRRRIALKHPARNGRRIPVCDSAAHLARLLIAQQRSAEAPAMLIPLLHDLSPLEQDTFTEWRAVLSEIGREVMGTLPPPEALQLAEAVRSFLAAPGDNHLTTTELASQAALERAVAKIKK